ncbi:uncharacterized protein N7500_001113 [Penicillium coprophilum]|uniref:uncharacterized protein n=1 Tax=Penicillium coprophilum TaxID=36646 RepID=UPI0023979BD5|nr:uncharacterized protein N7500_001113 [Penicillium coprophilum]KAJ5178414.1 hypothetical protein N7500_001113 [Penicillium coprophilum]
MFAWILIPLFEKIDARLEKSGNFDSLQKFRLSVVNYYIKHDPRLKHFELQEVLTVISGLDLLLRYSVQREESLKQKCQILERKEQTPEVERHIKHNLNLLRDSPKQYWQYERELYKFESSLPAGPLRRAYDTNRSNPKWYLHPDLTNDCAGRGGCCGRQCGCCEKREPTPERPRGLGHCTVECSCCANARGFEILPLGTDNIWQETTKRLMEEFADMHHYGNKTSHARYMRAFFSGLQSERDQAPKWK